MYVFNRTKTIESKLFPGVEIVFKKMTEDRRVELLMAVQDSDSKIQEALTQRDKVKKDAGDSGLVDRAALTKIDNQIAQIVSKEQTPAKIKWAVSSVKGLALGDESCLATLDNIRDWPSEFVDEVVSIIDEGSALVEDQAKNSQSPTTSGAVVVEATNDTSAPTV